MAKPRFNTTKLRLNNYSYFAKKASYFNFFCDNPFAFATLATFYLIQAGRDAAKKLEFKKKLLETANNKNFDLAKLQRLLSFVKLLVQLPKPFESVYQDYSNDSKNNKKAEKNGSIKSVLDTHKPFFGKAMDEVKQEGIEEGRRKAEVKAEVERKKIILYFYKNMGFDVEQIVQTTTYSIIFVQTIIDDYKQSLLKKES